MADTAAVIREGTLLFSNKKSTWNKRHFRVKTDGKIQRFENEKVCKSYRSASLVNIQQ